MLTTIDHISLAVRDLKSVTERYSRLFGREPVVNSAECSRFQLDNMALELAPSSVVDEGIASIAFAADDIARARHKLARRGIESSAAGHDWLLATDATYGVRMLLTQPQAVATAAWSDDAVRALDHMVITTSHPERAAALYGARLGLEMKLDRTNPDWGSRLLFFKCGDLIVEIAHSLKNADPLASDKAWGLSWRTPSVAAAHARLRHAGFDVSEIRVGRKPGTQVFTVRDSLGNVPTIVIGPAASNGVS